MACRIANGLKAAGVGPGDRVTLYSPNCWEWAVSYHGIAKTGAVINPINVMLTPDEVGYVVEDSGTKAVIGSADKAEPLLDLKGSGELNEVVLFGEEVGAGASSFEDWLRKGTDTFDVPQRSRDDLAAICYTSGTTGHPKGAMHSHRNIVTNAYGTALMHVRTERDVLVNSLPLPHVYGSVVFNSSFMYGMTLVMCRGSKKRPFYRRFRSTGPLSSMACRRCITSCCPILNSMITICLLSRVQPWVGKLCRRRNRLNGRNG
ncbi:MAG: hypothetical protein Ct9H300mP16_04310 [Pseudomonadota bacterium]|nr:MAG: hypothetical protein Ct9H300mP16_04310 [Pseudomonadota bacterium]